MMIKLSTVDKVLLSVLSIFSASNIIYFLSGQSSYQRSDILGLMAIWFFGSIILLISGIIFRFFWDSPEE